MPIETKRAWRRMASAIGALALLTGCASSGASATAGGIVVPPPASPHGEFVFPRQPANTSHVHGLMMVPDPHRLLIATHHGVELLDLDRPGVTPQSQALAGDVLQLAPGRGGELLAGGHNLGVQVSRDGGHSWTPVAPEIAALDVHGLASDPRNRARVYAFAVGHGMLVSDDGGGHWRHLAGQADGAFINELAVTADGTLLLGDADLGIYASTDQGAHFAAVRGGTGRVYSLAASYTDPNLVLAATENGLFVTTDGGKGWDVAQTSDTLTAVALDPANPRRFLAGGVDGRIFQSTDGGQSWSGL